MVSYSLSEILSLPIVIAFHTVIQSNGNLLQLFVFSLGEITMSHHVAHHDIAALDGVFWVGDRIIRCGSLQHTHQDSSLLGCKSFGSRIKICLAGRFDAIGITTEINGIRIHGENLILIEDQFKFGGNNPLFGLHNQHFHTGNLPE